MRSWKITLVFSIRGLCTRLVEEFFRRVEQGGNQEGVIGGMEAGEQAHPRAQAADSAQEQGQGKLSGSGCRAERGKGQAASQQGKQQASGAPRRPHAHGGQWAGFRVPAGPCKQSKELVPGLREGCDFEQGLGTMRQRGEKSVKPAKRRAALKIMVGNNEEFAGVGHAGFRPAAQAHGAQLYIHRIHLVEECLDDLFSRGVVKWGHAALAERAGGEDHEQIRAAAFHGADHGAEAFDGHLFASEERVGAKFDGVAPLVRDVPGKGGGMMRGREHGNRHPEFRTRLMAKGFSRGETLGGKLSWGVGGIHGLSVAESAVPEMDQPSRSLEYREG